MVKTLNTMSRILICYQLSIWSQSKKYFWGVIWKKEKKKKKWIFLSQEPWWSEARKRCPHPPPVSPFTPLPDSQSRSGIFVSLPGTQQGQAPRAIYCLQIQLCKDKHQPQGSAIAPTGLAEPLSSCVPSRKHFPNDHFWKCCSPNILAGPHLQDNLKVHLQLLSPGNTCKADSLS